MALTPYHPFSAEHGDSSEMFLHRQRWARLDEQPTMTHWCYLQWPLFP